MKTIALIATIAAMFTVATVDPPTEHTASAPAGQPVMSALDSRDAAPPSANLAIVLADLHDTLDRLDRHLALTGQRE